jgi:hypothetical protein
MGMLHVMCTFVLCNSTPGADDNDLQVVRVASSTELVQRLDMASVALVVRAEWENMLKDTVAAGGHTVVVTVKYDINFHTSCHP